MTRKTWPSLRKTPPRSGVVRVGVGRRTSRHGTGVCKLSAEHQLRASLLKIKSRTGVVVVVPRSGGTPADDTAVGDVGAVRVGERVSRYLGIFL